MLTPEPGDLILGAGCGIGIFTSDIIKAGARVVGLEIAVTMLRRAVTRCGKNDRFRPIIGDMQGLPVANAIFDKTVSITAIEFIQDVRIAVEELFRVTKPGGLVVVATLNALSPRARRREEGAQKGHPLFRQSVFRSPDAVLGLSHVEGIAQTAIHFEKNDELDIARKL